ncbi:MAG: tetratricopeptide repeat protein [Nitrospirota bacterium]|nr:tetratricopeptide repeat protein [Nitrospirota bacterium]
MVQRVLRESFVPVTLVLVGLFLVLLYVQYEADVVAERETVIHIAQSAVQDAPDVRGSSLSLAGAGGLERTSSGANTSTDPAYRKLAELMDAGKWNAAEAAVQAILAQGETSEALNDLGVIYRRQGRDALAREQFEKAVRTEPVFLGAHFNRALMLSAAKDLHGAEEAYKRVLEANADHFEARFNLGLLRLQMGDPSGAREMFHSASAATGGERKARALYGEGLALREMGEKRYPEAVSAFEAAIRLRPGYVEPRIGLAELQPTTNEGARTALGYFNDALSLAPSDPVVYFHLAAFHSGRGNTHAAIEAYLKAVQYNPEYQKARYNLGLLLLREKRWGEARTQFNWLLASDASNAEARFNLGRAAYGEKQYAEAADQYRRAIELRDGNYPEAWLNLGTTHARRDDDKAAIQAYQEALNHKNDYPEVWFNLGLAHMRAENWTEAEKAFRLAIRYRPDYSRAWFNLGVMFARQSHHVEAADAYRKALAIQPEYTRARVNLALTLSRMKDIEGAAKLYREALAQDPTYTTAWLNLGLAQLDLKQPGDAVESFRHALKLDPEDTSTMRHLARGLLELHRYDEAVAVLADAIDRNASDPGLRTALANVYQAAGRTSEAQMEREKARRLEEK